MLTSAIFPHFSCSFIHKYPAKCINFSSFCQNTVSLKTTDSCCTNFTWKFSDNNTREQHVYVVCHQLKTKVMHFVHRLFILIKIFLEKNIQLNPISFIIKKCAWRGGVVGLGGQVVSSSTKVSLDNVLTTLKMILVCSKFNDGQLHSSKSAVSE